MSKVVTGGGLLCEVNYKFLVLCGDGLLGCGFFMSCLVGQIMVGRRMTAACRTITMVVMMIYLAFSPIISI